MKKILVFALTLFVWASSTVGYAQISPSAYVTPSTLPMGQSTTFVRDGDTPNGFAWSEATLWKPNGQYELLGAVAENPFSQSITPNAGAGTYWIQFRLVDSNIDFQDQWLSFTVTAPTPSPNASILPGGILVGQSVTLRRAGDTPGGFGWTENVIWQPNGQAVVLSDRGLGDIAYTPTAGPGTYWYQFRLVDTFQNYADQWLSFTVAPAYHFQILVDTNQLNSGEASQAASFAADGVWSFHVNSPDITYGSGLWPGIMAALNAGNWTISEDFLGDWGITSQTQDFIGHHVNAQMVYLEASTPGYHPESDTILQTDQIDTAGASFDNPIVVLTRSYNSGGGEHRGDYTRQALANAHCGGVAFETNPEPSGGVMWNQSFNEGINYCLGQGKKCYLLLPPRVPCTDYLADVKAAMGYFAQSGQLGNADLYVVIAAYGRNDTHVGFLTGENGTGDNNSVRAVVNWLKDFRAGRASLP